MTRRIALLAVAVTALTTAVALAAPDHTGSLTPNGPAFTWDGGPLTGGAATSDVEAAVPCDPPQACDQTLLKVDPGQATVDITSSDPNAVDLDMFVFRSDKDGNAGKSVKSSTGPSATEHVVFEADAGYYLVKVTPATAAGGTFKGKATELPLPPAPADQTFGNDPNLPSSGGGSGGGSTGGGTGTTTGGGTPQATSLANDLAPSTVAKKPGSRRVRALSGTARDRDGKVAYVDVALARVAGTGCQTLTASGSFVKIKKCTAPHFVRAKGTTAWKLALKRALKPGTYVVYARATDNLGRVDAGFGSANAKRFTVKK
jgi:hypothetical protein